MYLQNSHGAYCQAMQMYIGAGYELQDLNVNGHQDLHIDYM